MFIGTWEPGSLVKGNDLLEAKAMRDEDLSDICKSGFVELSSHCVVKLCIAYRLFQSVSILTTECSQHLK